jgi:hypothetical protein
MTQIGAFKQHQYNFIFVRSKCQWRYNNCFYTNFENSFEMIIIIIAVIVCRFIYSIQNELLKPKINNIDISLIADSKTGLREFKKK